MTTPAAKIVLHTIMVIIMLLSSLCILIFNGIINDVAAPPAICPTNTAAVTRDRALVAHAVRPRLDDTSVIIAFMRLRDAGTSGRRDFTEPRCLSPNLLRVFTVMCQSLF
jgi:hypothetical protein